ncbi:MAG: hypothetical protein RR620_12205 [Clostridium sp.]
MFSLSKKFNNYTINCVSIEMGNDLNISIYGGNKPHIGAVALAIPRPSLSDDSIISSSASLLTVVGHKEDDIVYKTSKRLSSLLNKTIVLSCGIHFDNLSQDDIVNISNIINEFIDKISTNYTNIKAK